jgi:exopolysaccharide production protein ExoY
MSDSVEVEAYAASITYRTWFGRALRQCYCRYMKRAIDIFAVVATAPVTVPIIVLLAIIVSIDGGDPFYCQKRVGRNGKLFNFWKLRSMVIDADASLQEYLASNPAARMEWDITQKLQGDPRVTRFGRVIRKVSLDELPQLWNILAGDMSLVGPRPMLPEQVRLYPGQSYFQLTPGLTGFWQVADRNKSSFARRADYDIAYANSMSFIVDMKVICQTFGVILAGTGW